MEHDKRIDDIVAMLDEFMSNNGGHMNITIDTEGNVIPDGKMVETKNNTECSGGNLACNVPTLFEGLDIDINENK